MQTKLLIISIVIALCLSATLAVAGPHGAGYSGGTARLAQFYDYYASPGGEFTIYDDDPGSLLLSNAAYADVAKEVKGKMESFQTFCMERWEHVRNPMEVWVSTENLDYSTPGSHAYTGGLPGSTGDDLDPKTAYLYTMFATGQLAALGYDYNPGTGREDSAVVLQHLIWCIEGEFPGWIPPTTPGFEKDLWDAAVAAGWTDIGNVLVLQMHGGGQEDYRQDQLYYIPVPAAVLLGILGLGVVGIKLRKFA